MPAALHRQLESAMPNAGGNFEVNFNLMFTLSYFPNTVLPLFGGAVVDKYGESRCVVAFCLVILAGQVLTAFGVSSASWMWALSGRLVFGLGAQNLIVANASLLSRHFAGGGEGAALGLSNVSSYAGVILTNVLSPVLANGLPSLGGTAAAFWIGAAAEAFALCLAFAVVVVDAMQGGGTESEDKVGGEEEETAVVCSPM